VSGKHEDAAAARCILSHGHRDHWHGHICHLRKVISWWNGNAQSDGCFDALKIPYEAIRQRGGELGAIMTRVAIWDFNHNDQALMLPEAV
jgi:hypothetical protein